MFPAFLLIGIEMLFSRRQRADDQNLRGYLFGALSSDETERLDELSVVDDDFAARLDAVENDLVDAYVRGELSGDTLQKFQTRYLSSPKRREKVKFAESLCSLADSTLSTAGRVPAKPVSDRVASSFWPALLPFPRWALAGALAMLLVTAFLLVDNIALRRQTSQAEADRKVLQQREHDLQARLDEQHALDAHTANELEQVRNSLALLQQNSAAGHPGSLISSLPVSVAAFMLVPQARGAAQIADLSLPQGTTRVDLSLELESNDFPQYQVTLKSLKTDRILWHGGGLKAQTKGQDSTLLVRVPANILQHEAYLLEVAGTRPRAEAEFVSSYVFRIGSN
jgi:hypothetical protein